MQYNVEYTDTFGGESNYSWVKRATIDAPDNATRATIVRRAKKAIGLTGLRGRTNDFGEMIEFRPYGYCTVLFITWSY